MSFNGYFIKVGNNQFPNYIIAKGGYKSTPNMQTDQDSYTDGAGELHRNVLPHTRSKIWLKTVDSLSYSDKVIIQTLFPSRTVVTMEYWNDETNTYSNGKFYIPDITFVVDHIESDNKLIYEAIEITFIEY